MIHLTPEISDEARRYLESDNYSDRPILKNYLKFQNCFVCFHPFLKIKDGHFDKITFGAGKWPNKSEIEEHCDLVSWNEIIQLTGIRNIQSLDRVLAFYHRAYRYAERVEYLKLIKLVEKERLDIILPQVDFLPEIMESKILRKLLTLGYNTVFIYADRQDLNEEVKIKDILSNNIELPFNLRFETPDSKILIVEDFDQRFTYFFGEKSFLMELIESLELEGFFCNEVTTQFWSYISIPKYERMDWDEDMKRAEEINPMPSATLPKVMETWWQKIFTSK